jgi:hypothetical protein
MNGAASHSTQTLYRCCPPDDPDGSSAGARPRSPKAWNDDDDLPYRIELWNSDKAAVEAILAVTASGTIGFAAYHAATREYPDRYIVLRHRASVLSSYNGPAH